MALKKTAVPGVLANDLGLEVLAQAGSRPLVLHTRIVSQTGGGPEKTILNSPRFLLQYGYDCACVYLRDPRDLGFASVEQRAEQSRAPLIAVDDAGHSILVSSAVYGCS